VVESVEAFRAAGATPLGSVAGRELGESDVFPALDRQRDLRT